MASSCRTKAYAIGAIVIGTNDREPLRRDEDEEIQEVRVITRNARTCGRERALEAVFGVKKNAGGAAFGVTPRPSSGTLQN